LLSKKAFLLGETKKNLKNLEGVFEKSQSKIETVWVQVLRFKQRERKYDENTQKFFS